MPQYEVKVGINYPPEKRAEPGDIVDDLPEKSLPWLLEEGIVTEVGETSTEASEEGGETE
jgi:hypothetical protein